MGLTSSQGTGPIPREMTFPVPKGSSWHDLYDYIRYVGLIYKHALFMTCVLKATSEWSIAHIRLTTNAYFLQNKWKYKLFL